MKYDTLVLNKVYIPIHIIGYKRCMNLLYQDKAKALDKFPLKKGEGNDVEEVTLYGLNWPIEKDDNQSSKWKKYLNTLDK